MWISMIIFIEQIKQNWQDAWQNRTFKRNFIVGLIALATLIIFTYYFFDYIENLTGGVVMNDWVLKILPSKDVSIPIVLFELSVILLFLLRTLPNPITVITFIIAYLFILISRDITIGITQLRPPIGLIQLKDPIADLIYRASSINRDLFYSGHVSLLFLFYLSSNKKADKFYILFTIISVGILLLIQHVHYTVDVVCAPFFAYSCYWLSKKILQLSPKVLMEKA
jgi:hypothetical protein